MPAAPVLLCIVIELRESAPVLLCTMKQLQELAPVLNFGSLLQTPLAPHYGTPTKESPSYVFAIFGFETIFFVRRLVTQLGLRVYFAYTKCFQFLAWRARDVRFAFTLGSIGGGGWVGGLGDVTPIP